MIPSPDRLAAELTEPFGGPLTVEEVCLEADIGGSFDATATIDWLTTVLDFLGVAVVDGDCAVSLEVAISGGRTSAQYQLPTGGVSTCWPGYDVEGRMSVGIDGTITGTSVIDAEKDPPDSVDFCQHDDPLTASYYLSPALLEAFGPPAWLAAEALRESPAVSYAGDDMLASEAALDAVLAGLYHPDERVRKVALLVINGRFTWLEELSPAEAAAIPTLIAALDHYLEEGLEVGSLVQGLRDLQGVIGEGGAMPATANCPAHWWLLFFDEWEHSAPCDRLETPWPS